jgi:hypothetical protein
VKRIVAVVVAVAALAALPACGSGGGEPEFRAAGLVPVDAIAFASVALDPSDDQQDAVVNLVQQFPRARVVDDFDDARSLLVGEVFEDSGLAYPDEIEPWLGSEIAVAGVPSTDGPAAVFLAAFTNRQRAEQAFRRAEEDPDFEGTWRIIGDFVAFVDTGTPEGDTDALDRIARAESAGGLAKSERYRGLAGHLPSDRVLTGFVDGKAVVQGMLARADDPEDARGFIGSLVGGAAPAPIFAFGVHAEDDAAVLEAFAESKAGKTGRGEPALTENLPAGTVAALTLFDLGGTLRRSFSGLAAAAGMYFGMSLGEASEGAGLPVPAIPGAPPLPGLPGVEPPSGVEAPPGAEGADAGDGGTADGLEAEETPDFNPEALLRRASAFLGLDLEKDLLSWMGGESVVALGRVAPGVAPELGLLVDPSDEEAARRGLERLAEAAKRAGLTVEARGEHRFEVTEPLSPGFQPAAAVADGRFVLASRPDYLDALLAGGGERFAETPEYRDAVADDGSEATEFQLLLRGAPIRHILDTTLYDEAYRREAAPWMEPLRALAVTTRREDDGSRFVVRLVIGKEKE